MAVRNRESDVLSVWLQWLQVVGVGCRRGPGDGHREIDPGRAVGANVDLARLLDDPAVLRPAGAQLVGVGPVGLEPGGEEGALGALLNGGLAVDPQAGAGGDADLDAG